MTPLPYSKICEICGDEFTAKRSDARYCSGTCQRQGYRRKRGAKSREEAQRENAERKKATFVTVLCNQCGKAYESNKQGRLALYCSDACRQKAYDTRQRENTENNAKPIIAKQLPLFDDDDDPPKP